MGPGDVRITPQLVQAVRDAIDVVDIAGEMTTLQQRGKRYLGRCPFHKEKTPSFSVDPSQGLYYCFGCGAGGDSIDLYMQHTGDDFSAAIESLARRYGVPLPTAAATGRRETATDPKIALEKAADFFQNQLRKNPVALAYLDRRRISSELRQRFGLGYAPESWDLLLKSLRDRVPLKDLEATGLVGRSQKSGDPYDRFRHRLMFPIQALSGRLLGFGGRTLGDDKAKYINTSETDYFHKGSLLYGMSQAKKAIRDQGRALLVEGYFDVLGAVAAGLEWTVAGMGTALTPEQAKLLARYCDEVVVAYDGDEAGQKAFRRALPLLLAQGLGVRLARFPEGHDPDSLRLSAGPETVLEVVEAAENAVLIEVDRLTPHEATSDPRARANAAQAITELLKPIRDSIERYSYGQRAAERLGIPLELLWKRVAQPPEAADVTSRERPGIVRSTEEKALLLLLTAEGAHPFLDQLPPAEVFLNTECRNIYSAFCALYKEGGGEVPPNGEEVLSRVRSEGGAIDRIPKILLEEPDSGPDELPRTFAVLEKRWRKQQRDDLQRKIQQAQSAGDLNRLKLLLEEKTALSRNLHPDMTGNLW